MVSSHTMMGMELLTQSDIRDFRIRGNYSNRRSLLSRGGLHPFGKENAGPEPPWIFSPRGGV